MVPAAMAAARGKARGHTVGQILLASHLSELPKMEGVSSGGYILGECGLSGAPRLLLL